MFPNQIFCTQIKSSPVIQSRFKSNRDLDLSMSVNHICGHCVTINYMIFWSVHCCFHWCKNYKNGPRNARLIVENKAVPFLWNTVYCGINKTT